MNRGRKPEMAGKTHHVYLAGEPDLPIRKIGYTTNLDLRIEQIRDETGLPSFEMMDSFSVTGRDAGNSIGPLPKPVFLPPSRVAKDLEDIIKVTAPRTPYTLDCNQYPKRKLTEYFHPGIEQLFQCVKSVYVSRGYENLLERSFGLNREFEAAHSDFVKACGHDRVRLDGIKRQVYLGSRIFLAKNDLPVDEELESRMSRFVR